MKIRLPSVPVTPAAVVSTLALLIGNLTGRKALAAEQPGTHLPDTTHDPAPAESTAAPAASEALSSVEARVPPAEVESVEPPAGIDALLLPSFFAHHSSDRFTFDRAEAFDSGASVGNGVNTFAAHANELDTFAVSAPPAVTSMLGQPVVTLDGIPGTAIEPLLVEVPSSATSQVHPTLVSRGDDETRQQTDNGVGTLESETLPSELLTTDPLAGITTTGSDLEIFTVGEVVPATAIVPDTNLSGPLINIDAFRMDPRFAGVDGSGYAVVIIDTGIDLDHPFFGPDADNDGVADRIVHHQDFANGDMDASDFNNHGSNVSSIVASSDATFTGMAPGADIIHLKVFTDSGSGNFGFVETALQWVVANSAQFNIVSVNMSLSDNANYDTPQARYGVADEMAALAAQDVVVVSSSGNSFFNFNSVQGVAYPAADPNSLSIGAVYEASFGGVNYTSGASAFSTGEDRIAPFSQRHDELTDIFAPGAPITGANANGGTVTMHGTSQSAPHIAGITALAQQLAGETLGRRLTVTEYSDLLQQSADIIIDGDDEDDNVTNTGLAFPRVDVVALGEAILVLAPVGPAVTIDDVSVVETDTGTTAAVFTVLLSEASDEAISIDYATSDGTASAGSDYVSTSGTLVIDVGEVSATITVDITGDTQAEADEGFALTLSNPVGANLGGVTLPATGTIVNDDPALSIAALDATKPEGESGTTPYTFTVSRSGDTSGATNVSYVVTASGATPANATDFAGGAFPGGVVTFLDAQTQQTITIDVLGDTDEELDEDFTVTLFSPTNGAGLLTSSADGTIVDDDTPPPTLLFQESFEDVPNYTVVGGGIAGNGDFWTVKNAASPDLSFTPSGAHGDNLFAGRDLNGSFGGESGSGATRTVTFEQIDVSTSDGVEVTVSLGATPLDSFGDRFESEDYVVLRASTDGGTTFADLDRFEGPSSGSGLLSNGVASLTDQMQDFVYQIDDSATTLIVEVQAMTNGSNEAIVFDNVLVYAAHSAPPTTFLAIAPADANKSEGDVGTTPYTFTVTRSGDTSGETTVSYAVTSAGASAADANDFDGAALPLGLVTFTGGETEQTITLDVVGDTIEEADEGFTVTLSTPTGGTGLLTSTADGTIVNDDSGGTGSTLLFQESFEGAPQYVLVGGGNNGSSDFWMVQDASSPSLSFTPVGVDGDHLFAARDLNSNFGGEVGNFATRTVTFDEVNLSSKTGVEVTLSLGASPLNSSGNRFESEDYVAVRASTDGGATFQELDRFAGPSSGSGLLSNGVDSLSDQMQDFAYQIDDSANALILQVQAMTSDNNEALVFDNVRVETVDNTPPATLLSIAADDATLPEGDTGTTPYTFVVTRSGDTSDETSVSYAVTGSGAAPTDADDFNGATLPAGTVLFAPSETQHTISIDVAGDTSLELDETFTVTLSSPSGDAGLLTHTADGVILNDDGSGGVPVVLFQESFEGTSQYTVVGGGNNGNSDFWKVQDATSTSLSFTPLGVDGASLFVGRDLNSNFGGEAGNFATRTVTFDEVDLSSTNGVEVTLSLGATPLNSSGNRFESEDYIVVRASTDGGTTFTDLDRFEGPSSGSDLLSNGIEDLSDQMQDFVYQIDDNASTLIVEIQSMTSDNKEAVAFDNLRVAGIVSTTGSSDEGHTDDLFVFQAAGDEGPLSEFRAETSPSRIGSVQDIASLTDTHAANLQSALESADAQSTPLSVHAESAGDDFLFS